MRPLGDFASGHCGWILGAWLVLAAGMSFLVPSADPATSESVTYLPLDAPSRQAVEEISKRFPALAGLSEAVLVFERKNADLTPQDLAAVESIAQRISRPFAGDPRDLDLRGLHVRSPRSIPLKRNPLLSPPGPGGQAAIVIVEVPANFVTIHSSLVVRHIRAILRETDLPNGLEAAVTGSSGYGADYALAVETSNRRTSLVTVIAVLLILLVVYRAPLAALVPLAAVSLAAAIALKLLDIFTFLGMHSGTAERIFVFVLLYGAGTDYSLLLISRYRECLHESMAPRPAVAAALKSTLPAILASGITNTCGMLILCTARFQIFRTTGPTVAMALALITLASLTLVPAMLALFGRAVFWKPQDRWFGLRHRPPRREHPFIITEPPPAPRDPAGESPFWRRMSVLVTVRPVRVLAVSLVLLGVPAVFGAQNRWVYDQLTALGPHYDAVRGMEIVKRHWGIGQLGPVTILVQADRPLEPGAWADASRALTEGLRQLPDVQDVRSLSRPVGGAHDALSEPATAAESSGGILNGIVGWHRDLFYRLAAQQEYVSGDRTAMRVVVVLRSAALTRESMATVEALRQAASGLAQKAVPSSAILVGGATAEVNDLRAITTADFHRIAVLTVALIFVILLVLLRRAVLALFMAACTLLSYFAVLGLARWVFVVLLGAEGLDWKVEVFLFIVMVAVGVDYSIFLGARLVEETRASRRNQVESGPAGLRRDKPGTTSSGVSAAIRRAVVHTGPVISSCGVIMAATLGSLMTGDLALLHQLGFALALGMLLDTFVVRPLLVPSFAVVLGRRRR